jgi:hypothetical protein
VALYAVGFVVRIRCRLEGTCGGPTRLFDLDALWGLPRVATAGLFLVTAVLAFRASRRAARVPRWWTAIAVLAAGLALAKLLSVHSIAKSDSTALTLAGSVTVAAAVLSGLWLLGRRWQVAPTAAVVLALALYAGAAIGLDAVTSVLAAAQSHVGALSEAAATFVEELGEALAALVLLVTVRWQGAVEPRR